MENLNKLRWRCRRGTLELDILFRRYFDQCYAQASATEQALFLHIMELEDSDLIHYLIGNDLPSDPDLAKLCARMRKLK